MAINPLKSDIELNLTSSDAELLLEGGLDRAVYYIEQIRECIEDGDITCADYNAISAGKVLEALKKVAFRLRVYYFRKSAKKRAANP